MTFRCFIWTLFFLVGCANNETRAPVATQTPTAPNPTLPDAPVPPTVSKTSTPPQQPKLQFLEQTLGGGEESARLPWVLAFHGLGDRPESFAQLFRGFSTPSHLYVLQAPTKYGRGFDWFGVRASGDQQQLSAAIRKASHLVLSLIAELQKSPKNLGKPVVTGFSQGGMLSFALAAEHSSLIAASLPMGGWLPPPLWPKTLPARPAPLFAFHGLDDSVVPWNPTRQAIQHLQALGFPVEVKSYSGLGHSLNSRLRSEWRQSLSSALQKEAVNSLSSSTVARPSKQPKPTPSLAQ